MGTTERSARPQPPAPAAEAAVAPRPAADESAGRFEEFLFKVVLLVLAGLWVYSPVYHGDWLWDDDQLLTENLTVQHRTSPDRKVPENALATLAKLWVSPDGADYFPLSYTAMWAQWPFFHVSIPQPDGTVAKVAWPTGYHVVNIVLHILGALAFWRLLHVMRLPGAWLGGLVFAIHPVCVESVAWVSEIKNTLSQPLFLLACASFVQFDEATQPADRTRHYVLAVLLFLLAMLAKTAMVMFPVVILAYGWWKHGFAVDRRGVATLALAGASLGLTVVPEMGWLLALRAGKSSWALWTACFAIALLGPLSSLGLAVAARPRADADGAVAAGRRSLGGYTLSALPFFWISAILGLATCYFQWSRAIGQETIPVGGAGSRIATAGMAILFYLWKTVWPFHLLTIYPKWQVDPPQVWQFLPWPIMAAAGWWLWANRGTAERPTWQRHLLFVLAFFVLMLLPILGFITISYMRISWVADHFLYLPMIGVLGLATAAIATWQARAEPREQMLALVVGGLLLAVLGGSSFLYAHVWANEEALWPHTIAGHPDPCHTGCGCWQAHNRLGKKLGERGLLDLAHAHFQNSTRLRPDLGETHNNLGTTHSGRAQRFAQGGNMDAAKREMDLAIEQFREACRVTPGIPLMESNYANALFTVGRFGAAADQYRRLLDRFQQDPGLWAMYGVAALRSGDKEKAISSLRRALELNPNLKDAKDALAEATSEQPAPPPSAPQVPPLNLSTPASPTLGPAPLLNR
jgi:Tfp pilus assembly protein PilF